MNKKQPKYLQSIVLSMGIGLSLLGESTWAVVSGTVYRELPVTGINLNTYGVQEANEAGVAGVVVTVTDSAGAVVGSPVATDTNGDWTVVGTSGDVRVEFSNIPSYLESSPVNTGSNTTVQFISDGNTANLGLHNPADYVDSGDPEFVTAAYVNGDPLKASSGGTPASSWENVYRFNDSDAGIYNAAAFDSLAMMGDVGAVWGMAHQRSTNTVFAAAFIKRHVGLGSIDGTNPTTGGIYAIDPATSSTTPWLDLNDLGINTGADPHAGLLPADIEDPNTDVAAFAAVGKTGLGDIDLSEDEVTLYVMDLANRQLVPIDVASKTAGTSISVPTSGFSTTAGTCNADDVRPFAVKVKDNEVYIGVVCSAENSRDSDDLHAYMLRLDGGSFTTVLDFPLTFARGNDWWLSNAPQDWSPWARDWNDVNNGGSWPTYLMSPMFADIEFDVDGSVIMGFMDRAGHQIGAFNNQAINGDNSVGTEGYAQGDIYRACPNGSGGWVLESNGSCGGTTTGGAGNGEGPGGGEFYFGDYGRAANEHLNSPLGGLAIIPGSGRVALTLMDPVLSSDFPTFSDNARQMGVKWLSNTTGDHVQGFTLVPFTTNGGGDGTFSKANGMGELELLSDPAPLEIGNRIWDDVNSNGVQDAGEAGIDGVVVTLNCGGSDFTQTTANGGQYLFTDANVTGGIPRDTDCTISVPTDVNGQVLTTQTAAINETLGSNPDTGTGSFTFRTGLAGQNNHTYDIGYRTAPACAINQPTVTTLCDDAGTSSDPSDDTFTYTINATANNGGLTYSISGGDTQANLPYGVEQTGLGGFLITDGNVSLTLTDDTTATCTLNNVTVTAPASCSNAAPPPTCETIINTVSITALNETDTDNSNDSDSASIQANCNNTPMLDLRLVKSADKTEVISGENVIYTLALTNDGPSDGTNIQVQDNLPTGVTHVANNPQQGSYNSGTGIWDVGNVAAGQTVTLEITVTVD